MTKEEAKKFNSRKPTEYKSGKYASEELNEIMQGKEMYFMRNGKDNKSDHPEWG
eukprot:CAMPEP_0117058628 /NCGR_PEP_ID=MMETSP0472-20121206/40730_1 /TAXON_ID=693140 ORGANISM="Tiarina fusus, Strain LIS" /NCGR_SAMPLE_ID=MMETSP0472 /ASSEMBLY_ACC=CAM_ASM_000603 /LENGTH=53 /DNA_ID=CAMNT_0004776031 /DNA_START=136 /DNA_END=293 /DNA_ORIENTATION=-